MSVTPDVQRQRYLFYWCQRVLPAVFDDSLSYYELLCKVVEYLNSVIEVVNNNADTTQRLGDDVQTLEQLIQEIRHEMDNWEDGAYIENYIDSLIKYIDEHYIDFLSRIVKFVSFGLSKAGYFEAYIPLTWKFLEFNTIMDGTSPNYGSLVLSY